MRRNAVFTELQDINPTGSIWRRTDGLWTQVDDSR